MSHDPFRYLFNALDMFCEEVGIGVDSATEMLERSLRVDEYRRRLQRELLAAVCDPEFDWIAALTEGRTVADPETQQQGRRIAIDLL